VLLMAKPLKSTNSTPTPRYLQQELYIIGGKIRY